jgi:non-specific serine/threonine protein kinase/serine/threonine-protein kinase
VNGRLSRAEEIFHAVAEALPDRREELLSQLCSGDAELRGLVERLLAHDRDGMRDFLPLLQLYQPTETARGGSGSPRSWIGPYEILEEVGHGGMGTVYAARQTRPVERDVALKVIRAGMDTKSVIARFEAERQALALMEHPNIAKVLDAGETAQGQPYFVMELIRGSPITDYCNRRHLTTRSRLELFVPVCEAIQHAHQKAIIHRDLKPSNVLVLEIDDRPVPKVIDFGVAKATARRLTDRTMLTEHGAMIGTLEYMSPEQADPTSEDVDTRSDVYSLGVILYELLVGTLPFDFGSPIAVGYDEIRRRILEDDPKRPSTRLSPVDDRSTACATHRGTDASTLRRQIRGDLDWITMKALEKNRSRRYASPMDLAGDIRRHLSDEPVEARPPSRIYRMRKFVRRHRLGVGAAAMVTVALAAAIVGTSAGLVRARRAEAEARLEQSRSERAAAFLANTLIMVDPSRMGETLASTLRQRAAQYETRRTSGSAPMTRSSATSYEGINMVDVARFVLDEEILEKATERIEKELKQEPALASELYHSIGVAYKNLQLFRRAAECCERAVQLSEQANGRYHHSTIYRKVWLGHVYARLGRYPDAERVYADALYSARRTFGENSGWTFDAMNWLGAIYEREGRLEEAYPLLREALDGLRRTWGEDHRSTLQAGTNLGLALLDRGRYPEAETLLRDTADRMARVLGPRNAETVKARIALASVIYRSGRLDEAEHMALALVEDCRRNAGDEGYLTQALLMHLGEFYLEQGRYTEAEGLLRESAEKLRLVVGERHPDTQEAVAGLAKLDRLRRNGQAGIAGSAR